jgi:protein transport protein SEC61 subunit gamma and related proteins
MKFDFKAFGRKCIRVWRVLKKPQREEFSTVAKISVIGILTIGAIGFVMALVVRALTP